MQSTMRIHLLRLANTISRKLSTLNGTLVRGQKTFEKSQQVLQRFGDKVVNLQEEEFPLIEQSTKEAFGNSDKIDSLIGSISYFPAIVGLFKAVPENKLTGISLDFEGSPERLRISVFFRHEDESQGGHIKIETAGPIPAEYNIFPDTGIVKERFKDQAAQAPHRLSIGPARQREY